MSNQKQLDKLLHMQREHKKLVSKKMELEYTEQILSDVKRKSMGSFKLCFDGHNEYMVSTEFSQDEFSTNFIDDLRTIIKGERLRVERKILDIGWEGEEDE